MDLSNTVSRAASIYSEARRSGSVADRAYLDKFDVVNPRRTRGTSKQLLPISRYNEFDEPLSTEAALGHLMMTAGLGSEQYFWCNICCAYTGDRVRKLAKECDRVQRVVNVITNLRKDVHPFKGTALTVPARRMLKADVGCKLSLLDPLLDSVGAEALLTSDGSCDDHRTAVADVMLHPQPSFTENTCP